MPAITHDGCLLPCGTHNICMHSGVKQYYCFCLLSVLLSPSVTLSVSCHKRYKSHFNYVAFLPPGSCLTAVAAQNVAPPVISLA